MKNKEIKLIIFVTFLLLIFIIFLYIVFKPYNYEKEYIIDKYKITEIYNKKDKYYTFYIENENKTYSYIFENKYIRKRELIINIDIFSSDLETCILPTSEKLEFYPLCSNENSIYTYNLSQITDVTYKYEGVEKINNEYQKISINSLNKESFLLYNYKGFYLINENKTLDIELFDKDVYTLNLIYQKDNYIILPDYKEDYYFNKLYIINILNGKLKELEFEYDISYESIFLGDYKNNIYLLDKKEKKEYKINIKKKRIELVDFQTIKDNKLVKTTYKDIVNNNLIFPIKNIYNYELIDETLYLIINNNKIKISNKNVDKIVRNINETVYYLVDENLYMYNNTYGEVLLLSNFEWNFNNTNMIYLYK